MTLKALAGGKWKISFRLQFQLQHVNSLKVIIHFLTILRIPLQKQGNKEHQKQSKSEELSQPRGAQGHKTTESYLVFWLGSGQRKKALVKN